MRVASTKQGVPSYSLDRNSIQEDRYSLTLWGTLLITVIFMLYAPFQRGLFNGYTSDFDRAIYTSFVWTAIMLLIGSVYLLFKWQLRSQRDILAILVWLLPVCYWFSSIHAASESFAETMIVMHIMYATFFVVGAYFTQQNIGNKIIQNSLLYTSYILVLFGLLSWFGSAQHAGNFVFTVLDWFGIAKYRDAIMPDDHGMRLTSTFQYANTYGAYLIAVLLGSLCFLIHSRKWYSISIHAFMLVPISASLLLTLSRGALVVLPFVLLLCLFFFQIYRQVMFIINLAIVFAATLIILSPITTIGNDLSGHFTAYQAWKGWMIVVVTSLVVTVIIVFLQLFVSVRLKEKLSNFQKSHFAVWVLPIGVIVLGVIGIVLMFGNTGAVKMLPESVRIRVENINFDQNSVLERGTFYKDALKLMKDYPVLGAGGGAWAALYEKYQNNPYTSRQAHSFYFQYLVEVGILGTAILTLFLLAAFFVFIRTFIRSTQEQRDGRLFYFIIVLSLLIHSMIDFNMSYGYISALVFLCMGAMISGTPDSLVSTKWVQKIDVRYFKIFPFSLGIISIVFLIISVRLLTGDKQYKEAYAAAQQGKPFQQIMAQLDTAINRNPSHPQYALLKSNLLTQAYQQTKDENYYSQAVLTIDDMRKHDPNNLYVLMGKYNLLLLKNNLTGANEIIKQALKDFPWVISIYEEAISLDLKLGDKGRTENNKQDMNKYWDDAMKLYQNVLDRMQELTLLPKGQNQGNEFDITDKIALPIGQIYFLRGDYASAANMLKAGANGQKLDDQTNRMTTRWYLAALQKQNKTDQDLYNLLLTKDGNENVQVQNLVGMMPVQ